MAYYFGTEAQQRLQARVDAMRDWIAGTPGACNIGRCLGCDDMDALGWDTIEEIVRRDGALAFPLFPASRLDELSSFMSARGFRTDAWDAFVGEREPVLSACGTIVDKPLPEGLRVAAAPADPADPVVAAVQHLMADSGVAPYPGAMLAGVHEPAALGLLVDGEDRPVAVAFAHRPHNAHSPYRDYAFGAAVAVAADHRGRGLGRWINALTVLRALTEFECTHIEEYVSADNLPSRAMLASCGLRPAPDRRGVIVVASDMKFTR